MESLEVASKLRERLLAVEASARRSNEVFKQALHDSKLRLDESRKKEEDFRSALGAIGEAGAVAARGLGEWAQSLMNPDESKDKSIDQPDS